MQKIVLNNKFGGFSLSPEAYEFLGLDFRLEIQERYLHAYKTAGYVEKFKEYYDFCCKTLGGDGGFLDYETRTDPKLVKCVKVLGKKCNVEVSELVIQEIPNNLEYGIDYEITDYDGIESINYLKPQWLVCRYCHTRNHVDLNAEQIKCESCGGVL